jgi:tRNA A37 methylthiotransferase MiaB
MCENNTHFLSRARRYFQLNGHSVTEKWEDSDLIFVGGCAVTDLMRMRCEQAVFGAMQKWKAARFVVFGCLAAFPEGFRAAAKQDADRLHLIPYRKSGDLDRLIDARIPYDTVSVSQLVGHVPYQPRMGPDDFYVHIAQGCVNDCSYCNIKKAKGRIKSRPEEAIEGEVKALREAGIRTVTLLADDCGSYGLDLYSDLPKLIERLSKAAPGMQYKLYTVFPALFLRYLERLEPFFAKRLLPYICLPAQSGALRILDLMNRRYDPAALAEAISRIRMLDPKIFVYSHFIFNFPTETWGEFEQSIAFSRHFDYSVFIGYGENRSTRAAGIVPKCGIQELEAKTKRLEELVARRKLAAFVVPSP